MQGMDLHSVQLRVPLRIFRTRCGSGFDIDTPEGSSISDEWQRSCLEAKFRKYDSADKLNCNPERVIDPVLVREMRSKASCPWTKPLLMLRPLT